MPNQTSIGSKINQLKSLGLRGDAVNIEAARKELRIELARRDPCALAEYAFQTPEGEPLQPADFHREWNELIPPYGETGKVFIEAPHEHAKTTMISIVRVIWELGNHHNLRVRILCSDDVLSEQIISEISQHILNNLKLRDVFPDLIPVSPWTKTQVSVQRDVIMKDPSVQAESVLGGSTGGRCDLLIIDDIHTYRNTIYSPKLKPMVKAALFNVWMNTVTPEGRTVLVGTPWTDDDVLAQIKKSPDWNGWSKPAVDPETGKVLWPERWTMAKLRAKKRADLRNYQRGFELKPYSQEERTFTDKCIVRDPSLWWRTRVPEDWLIVAGLDPATAGLATYFSIAIDPLSHRRIPLELLLMFNSRPEDMCRQVIESYLRWQPSVIKVENNATQSSFIALLNVVSAQMSVAIPTLPIEPIFTGAQKMDLTVGLPALRATMEQGKWIIPYGCDGCGETPCICHNDAHEGCPSCEWISELQTHPNGRQDVIMAQWFCETAARDLEFSEADSELADDGGVLDNPESFLRIQF